MSRLNSNENRLRQRIATLTKQSETLSSWRVGLFLFFAAYGLVSGQYAPSAWFQGPTVLGFAIFGWLIFVQDRVTQTLDLFQKRYALAERARALSVLDWAKIPQLPPVPEHLRFPRYFSDLDLLTGHAVLRLINQTVSTSGFRKLLGVFDSNGVTAAEVDRRQQVTKEAARLRVLRRRFFVVEAQWSGHIESDRILEMLESPLHTDKAFFHFLVVTSVQLTGLALFAFFAVFGGKPFFLFCALALVVAYRLAARHVKILQAYSYGMSLDVSLGKFAALALVLERMSSTSGPHLQALLAPFSKARNPRATLARASRVVGFLGVRQNYILHLIVNLLVPWDFYWTLRLEKIRKETKARLPEWLETLSDVEVALSLAEFQVAHPDYVWPEISDTPAFSLRVQNVAHPLLPPETRIGNDLELNPRDRCVLITGSNMSGKSTFLRSLGVNLLLAKAGTVVCAKAFQAKSLDLATSLRLGDSLEDGLSSFYAEVKQLKNVLDKAQAGVALLYLIDEVFRGTNNRERLIGSQAFVKHLAQTQACGLITTHDLELATLANSNPGIRNAHFKEDIEGDKMSFSYRLAAGPCPTTNALRVMKLAGLPVD